MNFPQINTTGEMSLGNENVTVDPNKEHIGFNLENEQLKQDVTNSKPNNVAVVLAPVNIGSNIRAVSSSNRCLKKAMVVVALVIGSGTVWYLEYRFWLTYIEKLSSPGFFEEPDQGARSTKWFYPLVYILCSMALVAIQCILLFAAYCNFPKSKTSYPGVLTQNSGPNIDNLDRAMRGNNENILKTKLVVCMAKVEMLQVIVEENTRFVNNLKEIVRINESEKEDFASSVEELRNELSQARLNIAKLKEGRTE